MLQVKGLSFLFERNIRSITKIKEASRTYSDCRAPWFAGGAWCWTWWCICRGGGDTDCLICWIWTCWIFCGVVDVTVLAVVIFVLCVVVTGDEATGLSVTITTPVPLHVVHFVTVVTFFFLGGIFWTAPWIWIIFWFVSFTSNLMSPSGDTKICVGRLFWALESFWMQLSQRISFGPLRFAFCWICPPHVMHLCLSPFCCVWCWCWTNCSLIVWCNWAGSSDSAATIWICPKFWPLSEMRFWAWMMPGFCVTTVTVSLWESSWLWVLLCWLSSVKCPKIWLQTSHLKLMFEIVF